MTNGLVTDEMIEIAERAYYTLSDPNYEASVSIGGLRDAINAIAPMIAERVRAKERVWAKEPEYFYDPDDWENTYNSDMLADYESDIAIDLHVGEIKTLNTLFEGPQRFLTRVVVTFDEHGEPDKTEIRRFARREDAEAARPQRTGGDHEQ